MSSGPTQLSNYAPPTALIQSTGNLYWGSEYGIFRTSKSSQPGDEVLLYRESDAGSGGLTFAKVDGEFYGYFITNYQANGVTSSQVKRIPLGSVTPEGQATVLANSAVSLGDHLVTDGSFLYWADDAINDSPSGIRSMPIGGGPVTTLVAGTVFNLSLLGKTLYYTDGSSAIFSVPTGGGTPSTVVESPPSEGISALHVLAMPRRDKALAERPGTPVLPIDPLEEIVVVWGGFGVYGMVLGGGEITTYQEPTSDTVTTVLSVYATDQRVLWSTESDLLVNQVRMSYGNDTVTLVSETGEQYGPNKELLADEVAAYWGDAYVEKFTF